ncbi:MAG: hypothetical protein JSV40_13095 [Deltaproteobacteria bacterium]|nr:MAG: hypothetical protein JSV40_13095 [Deltaproteobacteria bacterium]
MNRLLKCPKPSFAVSLLLLVGCAGPLTMNTIQRIEQGMPSASFSSMVKRTPARVFTVVDPENGSEYQVQIYRMQTGTGTTSTVIYHNGYPSFVPMIYPISEPYAFLFRVDALLFWGFPHEYARSDEQSIRRLAPLIMRELGKGR